MDRMIAKSSECISIANHMISIYAFHFNGRSIDQTIDRFSYAVQMFIY